MEGPDHLARSEDEVWTGDDPFPAILLRPLHEHVLLFRGQCIDCKVEAAYLNKVEVAS
jgi:hypothetical protein